MKLPNGFGSVYKLSGKRRHPWVAAKTFGWEINENTGKAKQIQRPIGYYATKQEAMTALVNYNENPYDLDTNNITFAEVYEKWSEGYFPTLGSKSSIRTITAAYKYCAPLYNMKMRDIRTNHLEQTIKNADVGDSTKGRMKSIFNLMYKYAMKSEIVDKNYAQLCDSIKRPKPDIVRIPFSNDEISILWEHIDFPFVDMVIIGIYSGWRPQELSVLKVSDVDLNSMTYTGGLKTDAGKNRIVPIHPLVLDLVKRNYEKATSMNSEYLFNDEDGQQGTHLTYDKYRGRWNKIMKRLHLDHKPHDTRHTFITKAKLYGVDEYIIKLMVGHAINDITEKTYTHRTMEEMHREIQKIIK
ncbi:MAG: tyrosine-type recombinase/integrase [Eubacteriales bacterium]|nr:tyrosine-type recombinase/integrase [Eubacteriales bacterium]